MSLGGAAFLIGYGSQPAACRLARRPCARRRRAGPEPGPDAGHRGRLHLAQPACLSRHARADRGGLDRLRRRRATGWPSAIGAVTASFVFFFWLGYGARLLAPADALGRGLAGARRGDRGDDAGDRGEARLPGRVPVPSAARPRRAGKKKRRHKAGVKSLRQVSYRQETYRAVTLLYISPPAPFQAKSLKCLPAALYASESAKQGCERIVPEMRSEFFRRLRPPNPNDSWGRDAFRRCRRRARPAPSPRTGSRCMAIRRCRPDFTPPAAGQSRRAQGRADRLRRIGQFRFAPPGHPQGPRALATALHAVRDPDGPQLRRALHALRLAGRNHRDRAGPLLGRVHPARRGPVLRRQPGHRRRRDVVLRDPRHQGPPALRRRLGQGRRDGADRPALGALHLQRARPRAGAADGDAADPEEGAVGGRRFRGKRRRHRADRLQRLT